MAIRTIITRGFGNGTFNSSIALVVLRGYQFQLEGGFLPESPISGSWTPEEAASDTWSSESPPVGGWTPETPV